MSTEAQLKSISNTELASGTQIPALKHRTVNNAIIEEMYEAQSRGDVLAGVQSALSLSGGDQVLVIRSGQAYLLDATDFGFVDALADLTDVSIPSPANDQVLAYNSAGNNWIAKDVNDLTSVVSITGTATTNQMVKFTGINSIGNTIVSDNGTIVNVAGDLSVDNNLTVGTINSGTSSDFVKGDGSLDSTDYQGQIDAEESARIAADIDLANDISTNEGNITTNASNISTNASNIATNTSNISTNTSNIATNTSNISANTSDIATNTSDIADLQNDKQDISEKNQANGYAPLDSGAKIPLANLPDSVVGQVEYQGTWNASTNTPTLPAASGVKGHYYVVSVGGTYETIVYAVGDWIISNGTAWEKVDNTDAVTTVFGRLGAILANESDYSSFYPLLGTTISAGTGLTGGGDLSANRTISHDDTSSQGSVNNSGGIVIQDVTLDPFGHVTGLGSIDLDGRYLQTSDLSNYVTLNTDQTITAEKTFNNSGSDSNIIVNHTSGSGIALDITKGGSGEGLRVNKTSGSGDAVTVVGTIAATGGNSTEWNTSYDRSININPSFNTSNGVLTLTQQDSSTLTVDLDGRYVEALTDTLDSVTDRGATTTNVITVGNIALTNIADPEVTKMVTILGNGGTLSTQAIPLNSANTLHSVTTNGSSTDNSITVGGATINGSLTTTGSVTATGGLSIPNGQYLYSNRASGNLSVPILGHVSGTDDVRMQTTGRFYVINGGLTEIFGFDNLGNVDITGNLTTAGNLGIGTSPSAKLEVNGDIKLSSTAGSTSTPSYIWLGNDYSNGTTRDKLKIYLFNSGNEQYGFTVGNQSDIQYHSNQKHDFYVDNSPKLRIDQNGNVGIGTSSPSEPLHIKNNINGYVGLRLEGSGDYTGSDWILYASSVSAPSANDFIGFYNNSATDGASTGYKMSIHKSGNVGIGTTAPASKLHINAGSGSLTQDILTVQGGGTSGNYGFSVLANNGDKMFTTDNFTYNVYANTSAGNFGIGTDNPSAKLDVNGDIRSQGIFRDYQGEALIQTDTSAVTSIGSLGASTPRSLSFLAGNAERMTIDTSGNVNVTGSGTFGSGLTVNGAQGLTVSGGGDFNADVDILGDLQVSGNGNVDGSFSKGSGSFKIDHPLPEKKDTHHLVHSFVEAPRANNIYDGTAILVDGKAVINLDEEANMTEGTFVLLNRGIKVFTSNESGWDAVRGNVEGNILTIECQNPESTATVNWLVIGERQDKHMYDTQWTDENGRVITEPLKKVEPTPEEEEEEEATIIDNGQ